MRGQEVLVLIVSVISVTVDKDADGLWGTVRSLLYRHVLLRKIHRETWSETELDTEKVHVREQFFTLCALFIKKISQ